MRTLEIPEHIKYIRSLFVVETPTMVKCREWLHHVGVDGIQVGAEEGAYLAFLARMIRAKTIVEFGTLGGYSGLWLAGALPAGGKLITLERRKEFAEQAKSFFTEANFADRVSVVQGDALDELSKMDLRGQVDMVFVDAEKGAYMDYLAWSEQNLRQGGLLVADNTFLYGSVWQPEPTAKASTRAWTVMRQFNEELAQSAVWQSIMLPTSEGLLVAQKL